MPVKETKWEKYKDDTQLANRLKETAKMIYEERTITNKQEQEWNDFTDNERHFLMTRNDYSRYDPHDYVLFSNYHDRPIIIPADFQQDYVTPEQSPNAQVAGDSDTQSDFERTHTQETTEHEDTQEEADEPPALENDSEHEEQQDDQDSDTPEDIYRTISDEDTTEIDRSQPEIDLGEELQFFSDEGENDATNDNDNNTNVVEDRQTEEVEINLPEVSTPINKQPPTGTRLPTESPIASGSGTQTRRYPTIPLPFATPPPPPPRRQPSTPPLPFVLQPVPKKQKKSELQRLATPFLPNIFTTAERRTREQVHPERPKKKYNWFTAPDLE